MGRSGHPLVAERVALRACFLVGCDFVPAAVDGYESGKWQRMQPENMHMQCDYSTKEPKPAPPGPNLFSLLSRLLAVANTASNDVVL